MEQKAGTPENVELITEELFREAYLYRDVKKPSLKQVILEKLHFSRKTIFNLFPLLAWISKYSFKNNLMNDIIAGLTVAVMHVPHGLAYASLGRVEPVVGFYMAVFPVFMYMILGTSRHISMGTFAVVCAMTGAMVAEYETHTEANEIGNSTDDYNNNTSFDTEEYKPIEVGAAVCLLAGLWQLALGILRMGVFAVVMSDSLMSGFTAAAAVHVLSYQLKNIFGVNVPSFSGTFKLIYIYLDFFSKVESVNTITMYISLGCFFILVLFVEVVKPFLQRKFPKNKIPVPIELIVIVLGILLSYFGEVNKYFGVAIVGHIPTGFPRPLLPPLSLLPQIIFKSLGVACVALAINLSLAKIFAKKDGYEIFINQEFIAYGAANIFASFFQCLPSAASLSRSSIQFSVGGKTQLASMFSLTLIIFILLAAGSLFEPVPYSVLSAIVVISLKSLLLQVLEVPKIFKQSYADGFVWLGTFFATIILDLDYGLLVGVILSIGTIVFTSYSLRLRILERVPNTNIYLDAEHFGATEPVSNILILKVFGSLTFINSDKFQQLIINEFQKHSRVINERWFNIILNMSGVTTIDPTAVNTLKQIHNYLIKSSCEFYLTDCNINVYNIFEVCELFKEIPKDQILATVADAVDYLRNNEPAVP